MASIYRFACFLIFLFIGIQSATAANIALRGTVSGIGEEIIIWHPCVCVTGENCPCPKPETIPIPSIPPISYSIPASALVGKPIALDDKAPNGEPLYELKVDENAMLNLRLGIPVNAKDILSKVESVKDNKGTKEVPVVDTGDENRVNVSFSLGRADIWRYPGSCGGGFACHCYLDGLETSCAFVNSCLESGWCYFKAE